MSKAAEAFRTISEVAGELDVQKHVLRFWESRFPQVRPMKRGGGRRYYRPEDMELLRGIRHLLHAEGYTIKGVQKILREQGIDYVKQYGGTTTTEEPPSAKEGKRAAKAGAGVRMVPGAAQPARRLGGQTEEPIRLPSKAGGASQLATASELRAAISTAIVELDKCRKLLLEQSGKTQSARGPRRARVVGA
jgi:DNA-binding transcriptional MerR regulator